MSVRLVPSDEGAARKYYRPSEDGYARLAELEASWRELTQAVGSIPSSTTATTAKERA